MSPMSGACPKAEAPPVHRYAESPIPTRRGDARFVVFREEVSPGPLEHVAFVVGDISGDAPVLARAHSECMTSEVFSSRKCDCREQLDGALDAIYEEGRGVLLYLRQEGRGIGLGNKIRAYAHQAEGADTVEANQQVGFAADLRSYDTAAAMLKDLGVTRVALMTNNPAKIRGLEQAGIEVVTRRPMEIPPNQTTRHYLETKRDKLGHLMSHL